MWRQICSGGGSYSSWEQLCKDACKSVRYCDLFRVGEGVCVAAHNEQRYALDHFIRFLETSNAEQLKKAESHLRRARNDAYLYAFNEFIPAILSAIDRKVLSDFATIAQIYERLLTMCEFRFDKTQNKEWYAKVEPVREVLEERNPDYTTFIEERKMAFARHDKEFEAQLQTIPIDSAQKRGYKIE